MKTTIDHNHSEILIKIELDELDSASSRQKLADQYIELSAQIDQLVEQTGVNMDHSSLAYSIDVFVSGNRLDEEQTFSLLAADAQAAEKLAVFIRNVVDWCNTREAELWQDDESQQAEFAAYALCMQDEKYIPLYREQLAASDLDHEVYQCDHINEIVDQYGLTPAVLGLLAERMGAAHGQCGADHSQELQPELLALFREQPEMQALYLTSAVESVYRGSSGSRLWFESIRTIGRFIEDEQQREEWLVQQQQQAVETFGSDVDMTTY